jgi:hypothetical protein
MNGQTLIVAFVVAAAILFISRAAWRAFSAARAPKDGCGSDCGCGSTRVPR